MESDDPNVAQHPNENSPPELGGVVPRQNPSTRTGAASRLLWLFLLLASPCFAQEAPAWEIFGGYSFQRADVREYLRSTVRSSVGVITTYTPQHQYVNMNGWEFSATENRNRWFGGTLDISGYYKTPQVLSTDNREQIYSIFYGPQFSYRKPSRTAFAHILFGGTHTGVTVLPTGPHPSDFTFAMAVGGGMDMPLKNGTTIRILQADYLHTNALGIAQNNFRLSAGIVFNFGTAK